MVENISNLFNSCYQSFSASLSLESMAPRPLPKQIQRIRQNSIESNSSNGSRGPRTASVRLISSTSSQLSDLPEDMVVGNDDVVDEAENNDGFEGNFYFDTF